ncbi:hypothetical protein N2152v2_003225 [Parachlorella kessleri]
MFRKLKSLGGSKRSKYRLDVTVGEVEGLPEEVGQCRVVWARQAKVSVTKTVAVSKGKATFNEELSQIATLSKESKGGFESKEYHFKLQAPERGNQQKYVTLGKAVLDMARFTGDSPSRPQGVKLRLQLAGGRTATLSVQASSAQVKGMADDDGMSVVTGVSDMSGIDQDLSGFGDSSSAGDSRRASTTGVLARVTEEGELASPSARSAPMSPASQLPTSRLAPQQEDSGSVVRRLEEELATAKDRLAAAEAAQQPQANGGVANEDARRAAQLAEENDRLKVEVEELRARAAPVAGEPSANEARAQQQLQQVEELQALHRQNEELQQQVAALKAAAVGATAGTAAVVAGRSADAGAGASAAQAGQLQAAQARVVELEGQLALALEKSDSSIINGAEGIHNLQKELQDAQVTIASLQQELVTVKSAVTLSQQPSATEAGTLAGASPEVAAKLALYEEKIQQLMHLVEENGHQSDREAELEARLKEAEERLAEYEEGGAEGVDASLRERLTTVERELTEAETMATEALNLLEQAQAENHDLHEEVENLKNDMEWQQKKAVKEKADWEARMQDGFRRVEESVLLAERLQREKDELQSQCTQLTSERDSLEAKLTPEAMDEQLTAELDRVRQEAEAQARIEVEVLQARIREMEEFVEKADAGRLEAAARVAELQGQLAAVKREEQDSFDQVKSAEERADGLQLEVQYLQHEKERLQGELSLAREQAEAAAAGVGGEAASAEARAAELAESLEEAKASKRVPVTVQARLREVEQERGELLNQQHLLEEKLEASKLQESELQHKLAVVAGAAGLAGGAAVAVGANGQLGGAAHDQLVHDLEERKRAAESRAAQLEATSRELSQVRAGLQQAEAEKDTLRNALMEAERAAATNQMRLQQLEEAARARQVQEAQLEQLQRDMAAAMLAAKEHNSSAAGLAQQKETLEAELAEVRTVHAAELATLGQQVEEAHRLADYSSRELSDVVQRLAAAEAEKGEAEAKVAELRDELFTLRAGDDGELRARIAKLEKELLITRNARDVNALFKSEHDRIATELIETKLLWAEAQEQIVKLKQALVKVQEKNISFASKLTKLETKFYKRFTSSKDKDKRKKERGATISDS